MLHIAFVVSEPDSIEPFGVMSLVPHLTAAGHTCRLFCAEATDLIPALTSFAPQLVCYSSTSGAHTYLAEVNRALKESLSFISVFGGPHPTFFPDFIHEEGVDVIARGECDHSFALFCQGVVDHGHPVETPNFSIKTTRGISSSPVAPLIQDLDSLPFPDRESYYSLSPKIRGYTVRSFLASRGCPFSCSYCFNHSMDALYDGCFRRPRVRSPGSLIAEIREVIGRYPTEFLAFRESIFPLNTAWLITFARLMREHVRLPFYCHLRLDMVTPKRVALLREAGCHSVNVGIEAGSESIRRDLLGRDMSDETIIEGCRLLREAGIHILANNMLGLPSTTFAQDLATLRLNQRAKPHYSLAMLWQPYPGTRLARFAREEGWFTDSCDALEFSYYDHSHVTFKNPSDKRRVENLQRLFAVAAKFPRLTPLVALLTRLPPNPVFDSIFKTVYLVYHQSEIFPHRMTPRDLRDHLRGLLE